MENHSQKVGREAWGWWRRCPTPGGCWGRGKGSPAAALPGFAPQQVMAADTGLELVLGNKRQKTERVY